jgi:hypothetical protein
MDGIVCLEGTLLGVKLVEGAMDGLELTGFHVRYCNRWTSYSLQQAQVKWISHMDIADDCLLIHIAFEIN